MLRRLLTLFIIAISGGVGGLINAGHLISKWKRCLTPQATRQNTSTDSLGDYFETVYPYKTLQGSIIEFSLRTYTGNENVVVYKQHFVSGLLGTSIFDKDQVNTGWPVFKIASNISTIQYVTPGGYMLGWTLMAYGKLEEDINRFRDGESGGIVVLYDQGPAGLDSLVMSALHEPMAVNVWLNKTSMTLHWGIQGRAENIPPGYAIEVIVSKSSTSIVESILEWGQELRNYHSSTKRNDPTVDYLSYWTDNGAYHYYNPLPFTNFDALFRHIYDYSQANNIPIRFAQIDSWWYYKGDGRGVKEWSPKPAIFPNGLEPVHNYTQWDIIAHNRYFSADTVYSTDNGGDFLFTIDEENQKSLPLEKRFWDYLLDEGMQWGLTTYEQDWLDRQYEGTRALHTNVTLGSTWLNDMGHAAEERGLAVQYCMSFPRHALHSVQLPSVTQIRVSDDYMLTPNNWRIGLTSLFAYALGLAPYKDVFWSSRLNEDNLFYGCELHIAFNNTPLMLSGQYGGRKNTTRDGTPCLYWSSFGWDKEYPHAGLRDNLCRNPDEIGEGAFCFTNASFDIPEENWIWDYCEPPQCDIDCYTLNGYAYVGDYNITETGKLCADWNGAFGLYGAACRNPTQTDRPWCYVDMNHVYAEYCNNKCPNGEEFSPSLQSAVSTLSGGPVGVGDMVENLDRELIMKSCNAEGLLLKMSKPMTVIDKYLTDPQHPEIWTSWSVISDHKFGTIFLAETEEMFSLTESELNLGGVLTEEVMMWQSYPEILPIQYFFVLPGNPLLLPSCSGFLNFCIWQTSPVHYVGDMPMVVLGEMSKWAVISPNRISNITVNTSEVTVNLSGVQGERVDFYLWSEIDEAFSVTCSFTNITTMSIQYSSKSCM